MLTALSAMSIVVTTAIYEGREDRSAQRAPRDAALFPDETVTFRYAHSFEAIDLLPLSVIYLQPMDASAPPPPGLLEWPTPGHTVASPALLEDRGPIESVYGPIVATISPEGLASPGEKLLYFVPPSEATLGAGWSEATGFGADNRAAFSGEIWSVQPAWRLIILFLVFLLVPALVLLEVVAAAEGATRRRRGHLLEIIGAPPRTLLGVEWHAVWPAVVVGSAAALAVAVAGSIWDLTIPFATYTLDHRDIQAALPSLAATSALAAVVCAALILVRNFPRRMASATRPRAREPRYRGVPAAAAVLFIGICGLMAVQEAVAGRQQSVTWVAVGTAGAVLLIPFLCGWLIKESARYVHHLGSRRGRPALLVAGAQISGSVPTAARLASLTALLIFLTTQAAMFTLLGQHDAAQAESIYGAMTGRFAVVDIPTDATDEELSAVLDQVPPDTAHALVENRVAETASGEFSFETSLTASSADLQALGLHEEGETFLAGLSEPLRSVVTAVGIGEPSALVQASSDLALDPSEETVNRSLVLAGIGSSVLDSDLLQARVNQVTAPGWHVGTPGDGWRVGARLAAHQSRWIAWAGLLGAAMVFAASWTRSAQDTRHAVVRSAPIGALTGASSFFYATAAARVAIVVVVGTLVGGVAALHFATVVTAQGAGVGAPYYLIGTLSALAVVAGVFVWWLAGRAGTNAATEWRPGGTT